MKASTKPVNYWKCASIILLAVIITLSAVAYISSSAQKSIVYNFGDLSISKGEFEKIVDSKTAPVKICDFNGHCIVAGRLP